MQNCKVPNEFDTIEVTSVHDNSCDDDFLLLLKGAFQNTLLGEIELSDKESSWLYEYACTAIWRARFQQEPLTSLEEDALVLCTIILLRDWNGEGDGENFWEFICEQYAIPYSQPVRMMFTSYVDSSFSRNNLLFATTGHKYYTSLLAHALSPKKYFFTLFEKIYGFYAKSLNYQYTENDKAFHVFSLAMQERFMNGVISKNDVYIKALQSSSAIKLLFTQRVDYMTDMTERVVRLLDELIESGSCKDESYLAKLVSEWYEARDLKIKTNDKRERQKGKSERIETDFSRIRASYKILNEKAIIALPAIRLGKFETDFPVAYIYCGEKLVHSEELMYYGDDIYVTSKYTEFLIETIEIADGEILCPRVTIVFNGSTIFDSGEKLYRDAVVFGEAGEEISKLPDNGYIYVLSSNKAKTDMGNARRISNREQLYHVSANEAQNISVNGKNLFPKVVVTGDVLISLSLSPIELAKYVSGGHEYEIFSATPTIYVSLKDEISPKRYRIRIDGESYPLAKLSSTQGQTWKFTLPNDGDKHEIYIQDVLANEFIYSLNYIIKGGFSLKFDRYFNLGKSEKGAVEINGMATFSIETSPENDFVYIELEDGELLISPPMLKCKLNGVDKADIIWHKSIPTYSILEIEAPQGYNTSTFIGTKKFESNCVEIGNAMQSYSHSHSIESVLVELEIHGEKHVEKLFRIAFEPQFKFEPLAWEDHCLIWIPENNFIGDNTLHFTLSLFKSDIHKADYVLENKDDIILLDKPLEDGCYDYVIKIIERTIFSDIERQIHSGTLIVGNLASFQFDQKALIITKAHIDSENNAEQFELSPNTNALVNLQYIGEQALNGENNLYPCYEACLMFKDFQYGTWRKFSYADSNNKAGKALYQVNPIRVWLINKNLIALRTPEHGGPYLNMSWKSITHFEPAKHEASYFDIADYFSYKITVLEDI